MSDSSQPTPQLPSNVGRHNGSTWSILGLVAAVVLGSILYFSFSGDLIDERSTAIPSPSATSAPIVTGPANPGQPSVPSTK